MDFGEQVGAKTPLLCVGERAYRKQLGGGWVGPKRHPRNCRTSLKTIEFSKCLTYSLTTGINQFTGGSGDDTFTGILTGAFNSFDSVDGGAGTGDTLSVTDTAAIDTTTIGQLVVKNMENVTFNSLAGVKTDVTTWGTTALNVTNSTAGNVTITAPATTAVVAGNAFATGTMTVTGGLSQQATVVGGNMTLSGSVGAITASSATTAATTVSISGGTSVGYTATGVTTGGAITVGSSATSGAITATITDSNTTAVAGSAVTVNGGTTVVVTENITAGTSGAGTPVNATGGSVTVAGGAVTTSVSVTQTPAVTGVGSSTATAAVAQVIPVNVGAGGLAAGAALTVGGLTFTANAGNGATLTQAQLGTVFASLADGATVGPAWALGAYSGKLTGWTTSAVSSNVVTFTATTAGLPATLTTAVQATVGATGSLTLGTQTAGVDAIAAVAAVNGIANGAVAITDKNSASLTTANTITSVTLSGYGTTTIADNALTTLSLANSGSNVTVTDAATVKSATLGLTVNKLTAGTITDATVTALNVTSTGTASTVTTLSANAATSITIGGDKALTVGTLTAAADTALTVNGSALTTISAFTTANKLATVTISGAGGFAAPTLGSQTALTSINASGASGPVTVTVLATKATYSGGSGIDTVTVSAAATKAISGGDGTADVLVLNGAGGTLLTATTGAFLTNFETLSLGTAATGDFNLSNISGITALTQGAIATPGVTYSNVAAGVPLTMTAAPGFTTGYSLLNSIGSTDSLALTMTGEDGFNGNTLTAGGIESINITATDTKTSATFHTLDLDAAALKTLTISGNAGLALTTTGDLLTTSVNASGLTGVTTATNTAKFSWITPALTVAATITGSATLDNTVNFSAATKAVTYVGGAGNETITAQNGQANTVTLGNGNNVFTHAGSAGIQSVTGGTGSDTITGGTASDVIVGGGGIDIITGGGGADKITVSGGTNLIKITSVNDTGPNTTTSSAISELTATWDVIYGLTSTDKIDVTGAVGAAATAVTAINLAGVENTVVFARGTYDATAGTFAYGAAGADSVMTFDTLNGAGGFQSLVLVGFVSSAPVMDTTVTGLVGLA